MKSSQNFEPELTQVEPELTKVVPDVKVELEKEARQMTEDNLRVV